MSRIRPTANARAPRPIINKRLGAVKVAAAVAGTGDAATAGAAPPVTPGVGEGEAGGVPDVGGGEAAVAGGAVAVAAGVGVAGIDVFVAGIGVPVAGIGVFVAGIDVFVAGIGVPVAGIGVFVAGIGVFVAGIGVPVAGIGVPVAGIGVSVGRIVGVSEGRTVGGRATASGSSAATGAAKPGLSRKTCHKQKSSSPVTTACRFVMCGEEMERERKRAYPRQAAACLIYDVEMSKTTPTASTTRKRDRE